MMYRRPARRPIPVPAGPKRSKGAARAPGSRRVAWVAGAVVVVAGAVVAAVALSLSGGSTGVALGGVALAGRYQVVYQVTTSNAPTSHWEVLTVTDPFDVSDLTYTADPRSGARPSAGSVSTYDALYDLRGGRLELVTYRQPALGSGDQALVTELGDLTQWGLATRLPGRRTVAGVGCDELRVSEPPAGPLTPIGRSGHDDLCLTRSGVELAETWTLGGKVVLRRTAVEVTIGSADRRIAVGPAPAPAPASAPAPAPAPGSGAPGAEVLVAVSRPAAATFLLPPPTPSGFEAMPSVHAITHDPTDLTRVADVSDVWAFRRGGALITVEAGTGQTPWNDSGVPTRNVLLKKLGPAVTVLRSDGPQVQVQMGGSRWVRVGGTVALAQLVSYASELVPAGPAA
jgi:hypothetical protein